MELQELFEHVEALTGNKRHAIQIFLAFDDYLIDNLTGYCDDDCEIDFGAYATEQVELLENDQINP
jgi:hypothetical protein